MHRHIVMEILTLINVRLNRNSGFLMYILVGALNYPKDRLALINLIVKS